MHERQVLTRALGVAGVGLAVLMGGCRTARTVVTETPGVTVRHADGSTEISREIVFSNSRLARDIQILEVRRRITPHGLLNPSVTVLSTYGGTLKFEYRFCWFDRSGYEIAAETNSWKPVALQNKESKTFESVAPNADVKEFRIRMRSR